jgi:hypothetical protein
MTHRTLVAAATVFAVMVTVGAGITLAQSRGTLGNADRQFVMEAAEEEHLKLIPQIEAQVVRK